MRLNNGNYFITYYSYYRDWLYSIRVFKKTLKEGMDIQKVLPGMGSSIRYKGLAGLLIIRLVIAFISFLINRKNEKSKKRVTIVLSCIGGIIIFAMSMLPAFVIRDYNGRETTGEYEFAQAQAILIDENRVETF